MPVKIDLRTLNKAQPGRVEKPKLLTLSGLNEALKLVKNLSSGNKAGSSGKQNEIQDPVVSKLLDFVKDITQGGSRPSAVSTKSVALAPGKPNRKERRQANREKRAALAQSSATFEIDLTNPGMIPPPPPLAYSERTRTESEVERLLALTPEEIAAGHGSTPVNTSQDNSDLMDMALAPVHPRQVENLAEAVQRVAVQDQESEQRPSDLS